MAVPCILIADPDCGAREGLAHLFREAGWQCEVVEDGRRALDAVAEKSFDLVFSEIDLPAFDGFALLSELRRRRPEQEVILTAIRPSVETIVRSLKEGAADILEKPLEPKLVRQAVERVLGSAYYLQRLEDYTYQYLSEERISFEVPSGAAALHPIQFVVADRLRRAGVIDRQTELKLQLAFQEAVANALEHGNLELLSAWRDEYDQQGMDRYSRERKERLKDARYADRKLYITMEYQHGRLSVTVRDEGAGFPLQISETPTSAELAQIAGHGRGLSIICGTMDEVLFQMSGRELTMVKYLCF